MCVSRQYSNNLVTDWEKCVDLLGATPGGSRDRMQVFKRIYIYWQKVRIRLKETRCLAVIARGRKWKTFCAQWIRAPTIKWATHRFMYESVNRFKYSNTHTHIYIHTHTHACSHTHTRVHTHKHAHIHTYTHTHTHTQTLSYTCTPVRHI
jgi:hypothetical protein